MKNNFKISADNIVADYYVSIFTRTVCCFYFAILLSDVAILLIMFFLMLIAFCFQEVHLIVMYKVLLRASWKVLYSYVCNYRIATSFAAPCGSLHVQILINSSAKE